MSDFVCPCSQHWCNDNLTTNSYYETFIYLLVLHYSFTSSLQILIFVVLVRNEMISFLLSSSSCYWLRSDVVLIDHMDEYMTLHCLWIVVLHSKSPVITDRIDKQRGISIEGSTSNRLITTVHILQPSLGFLIPEIDCPIRSYIKQTSLSNQNCKIK